MIVQQNQDTINPAPLKSLKSRHISQTLPSISSHLDKHHLIVLLLLSLLLLLILPQSLIQTHNPNLFCLSLPQAIPLSLLPLMVQCLPIPPPSRIVRVSDQVPNSLSVRSRLLRIPWERSGVRRALRVVFAGHLSAAGLLLSLSLDPTRPGLRNVAR